MSDNLFQIFKGRFPADRTRTFIERSEGGAISYAELLERSGRLASALTALGVAPGDRVAVQVEKSADAIMLYLATVRAGAVYLPLNTAYTTSEIRYFLGDSEPALFVCDPKSADTMRQVATEVGVRNVETLDAAGGGSLTDKARGAAPDFAEVARGKDDLAASGHDGPLQGRNAVAQQPRLERARARRDVAVHGRGRAAARAADLPHARPVRGDQRHAVRRRLDAVPAEVRPRRNLPTAAARDRDDGRADLLHAHAAGPAPHTRGDGPHAPVRRRLGAAARRDTPRVGIEDRARHPRALRHDRNEHADVEPLRRPARTGLGRPSAPWGRAAHHRARHGQAAAARRDRHDRGEGPQRVQRLLAHAGEDRGRVPLRRILHHRRSRQDRRDGYVYIVGRGKDLVITGGYNVYPKEIETEIDALEGVVESAVIGVPHSDFGEGVTAVVVQQEGASLDERAVVSALDTRLAKYKLPKRVLFVDHLPRNAMGKVLKNELRDRFRDLYAAKRAAG